MRKERLREDALAYLKRHNVVTLATVGEEGLWAAAVFYVNDSFTLYFLSDPKTRHCQALSGNPRVAAAIHEDYDDWKKLKGIQLEGKVEVVTSRLEKAKAMMAYVAKFPFVREFLITSPLALSRMLIGGQRVSVKLYRLTPSHLFYLDNEKGFSQREEVPLP